MTATLDQVAAMEALRARGLQCTRCPLYQTGHPVVWGEGSPTASIMVIGQGPGDVETRTGRPFVGPAGQLFDQALVAAGIRRDLLWLTNGLKHWATTVNERGNVVNRPPRLSELRACRVWLEGELAIVRPRLILCLGNSAVQALTGQSVKITQVRGAWFDGPNGVPTLATAHPSYLLRLRGADPAAFEAGWATLLADLRRVVERATALGIAVA